MFIGAIELLLQDLLQQQLEKGRGSNKALMFASFKAN